MALNLRAVPRIKAPVLRAFRDEFLAPSKPVIIEGALDNWPARMRWSEGELSRRFGDRVLDAYAMENGRIRLDRTSGFALTPVTFGDYLRDLRSPRGLTQYVRTPLPGALAELLDDVRTPVYCSLGTRLRRNLWISAPGVITHCHFDLPDNLVAFVQGAKRFLLYPPSEGRNLYRHSPLSSVPHLARVDLAAPDVLRFPRLARAVGFEANLTGGDLLFIPARWWHWAESLDVTMSVNFWTASPLTAALLAASDLYKRVRSLNI